MSVQLNFNATEVPPAEANFEMIPAGWYRATVEKAELKPTKAGTGSYISIQVRINGQVDTGEYANRVVFGNINYLNPSAEAQEIGQRQLSALCHSIGVMELKAVEQLCGIPHEVRVKQGKATYNVANDPASGVAYEARNEIQGFRALGGGTVNPGATGSASAATAPVAKPAAPAKPTPPGKPAATTAAVETAEAEVEAEPASPVESQPNGGGAAVGTPKQPW